MVLSKREQVIVIVTLVIVVMLVGDKFVLGRVTQGLAALEAQRQEIKTKLKDADALIVKRNKLNVKWQQLTTHGFHNDAEAESKVMDALNQWSRADRLKDVSIRPGNVPSERDLQEKTFAFGGNGTMTAVGQFVLQIETSPLPIKIKSMQLGSAGETGEQMNLTLTVSAVYPGKAQKTTRGTQTGAKTNEDQAL